ncbi:hypothetical protein [Desulfonatronospira sp. MSAO_Bac3]|uniref:hypothetical protein n=1 Tax=Desulfonatronospira sp. MSAO_Bac3 TaxID=2293857 RepID=UPI0025802DF0|nr:hypothetical protein [Desulfonatronospira sp. MSAO_Bac3]
MRLTQEEVVEELFVERTDPLSHDRPEPCAPETTIDMQGVKMMLNKTFDFFHI